MIYLDTSVALAQLLAEDRQPPPELWGEPLVSSRLLEYEMWNRLYHLRLGTTHGALAEALIGRLGFVELLRPVLTRAVEPFPVPVRTLDALHLASIDFLQRHGQKVRLASYDDRLNAAARKVGVELFPLE